MNVVSKRVVVLSLALWGLVGCRCEHEPAQDPDAGRGISRGDHVVVEQTAAEFFEGRVLEVEPNGMRVEALDGGATRQVANGDAYRVTRADKPSKDDLAICRLQPSAWVGCRIDDVAEKLTVSTARGERYELGREDVIHPTPVTVLNIRRAFERSREEREFAEAARAAGVPRAPDGWHASPRERVVAKSGKAWFSARVREIEDDGIYVEWRADARVTKVILAEVVPDPPSKPGPKKGGFALLRPEVVSRPWEPVKIVGEKDDRFTVADADGEERAAENRDLLPLRR